MQIIVQEGKAILSLAVPIQAHDESLRTTTMQELTEEVKVYYRDYEVIRVECRGGDLEVIGSALSGIFWVEKGRRYQLQVKAEG